MQCLTENEFKKSKQITRTTIHSVLTLYQALAGMNNQTNPVTNKSSCQIWRANQPLAHKDSPTITTYYKHKRMKHQSKNVKHTNQTTRNCTNGANIKCTNQATTPSKSQTNAGMLFSSVTCFEDCRWRASAQTTIQCTNEQTSNVQTKQPVHPSHKPRLARTSLLSPVLKTAGTDNHPTHKPNKHQLYKPSNQAIQVTNQGWQALLSSHLFWRLQVKNQTTIQCTNQTNIKRTNQASSPSKSQSKAGTLFSPLTCFEDCRWSASAQTSSGVAIGRAVSRLAKRRRMRSAFWLSSGQSRYDASRSKFAQDTELGLGSAPSWSGVKAVQTRIKVGKRDHYIANKMNQKQTLVRNSSMPCPQSSNNNNNRNTQTPQNNNTSPQ